MEQNAAAKTKLFSPSQIAVACVFGTYTLAALMLNYNNRKIKPKIKYAYLLEAASAAIFTLCIVAGVYRDEAEYIIVMSAVTSPYYFQHAKEVLKNCEFHAGFASNILVSLLVLLSIFVNIIIVVATNSLPLAILGK